MVAGKPGFGNGCWGVGMGVGNGGSWWSRGGFGRCRVAAGLGNGGSEGGIAGVWSGVARVWMLDMGREVCGLVTVAVQFVTRKMNVGPGLLDV